jgi:hypothetical protein
VAPTWLVGRPPADIQCPQEVAPYHNMSEPRIRVRNPFRFDTQIPEIDQDVPDRVLDEQGALGGIWPANLGPRVPFLHEC